MKPKKIPVTTRSVEGMCSNDKFIELLSDELMLDELLCGEANSCEFLKRSLKSACVRLRDYNQKQRIARMSREDADWIDG